MSLVVPSNFQKTELSEREALVRHGQEKAQKDFAQEEAEGLIKKSYQAELDRLRKGEAPVSQPKPAIQPNPPKPSSAPTTTKESEMEQQDKRIKAMTAQFMAAQPPSDTKTIAKFPTDTSLDPNMARRVVECWNASSEAKKDFKDLATFYDFAIASEKKDSQLPAHRKDLCGLPFYERRAKRNS